MAKRHCIAGGQAAVAFGAQIEEQRARLLSAMGVVGSVEEVLKRHDMPDGGGEQNASIVSAWSALRAAREILDSACWKLGDLADVISAKA